MGRGSLPPDTSSGKGLFWLPQGPDGGSYKPRRKEVSPKAIWPASSAESAHAHFMPCWKTEFRRVLQMIRSAHCTTTMLAKKAVWQVNSTTFRCSYVCREGTHTAHWGRLERQTPPHKGPLVCLQLRPSKLFLQAQVAAKLPTHPLLAVAVLEVVFGTVVPVQADAQQSGGQEPVLGQDDKIGEEAPQGLDHAWEDTRGGFPLAPWRSPPLPTLSHGRPQPKRAWLTNLPIGHADEALVHQLVRLRVPRLPFHDVAFGRLVGEGDCGHLKWEEEEGGGTWFRLGVQLGNP